MERLKLLHYLKNKPIILLIIVWYLFCNISPFIDYQINIRIFVHDFNIDGKLVWFIRDLNYVVGILLLAIWLHKVANGYIIDKIEKSFIFAILIDSIYEVFDLLVFNNDDKTLFSPIIQNSLIILSFIISYYNINIQNLWKKLKKSIKN